MAIKTLLEFATDATLTRLLVKERIKQSGHNSSDKTYRKEDKREFELLPTRKKLSRLMPARYTWVRPSKRIKDPKGKLDKRKNNMKALLRTIYRDKKKQKQGAHFIYLDEQQAYFSHIRTILTSDSIKFQPPVLMPIYKDKKSKYHETHDKKDTNIFNVTCRPLSVYSHLDDKIILALTSLYLTRYFDEYLHENILSYRPPRKLGDKFGNKFGNKSGKDEDKPHVTDFNDGIRLIMDYRLKNISKPIYAADCDIKKFYDIIPHQEVINCFNRLFDKSSLSDEGRAQVMRVINAYLDSYNFNTNAWRIAEDYDYVYNKVRRRLRDIKHVNSYKIGWPDELGSPENQPELRGVPQGGALSLLIANIVLNDVDQAIIRNDDPNRLFIRYCDDIILLHTDESECERLISEYARSLESHGLVYHPFKYVSDCSRKDFWDIKSHHTFLWGEGDGNCNRYIGFLGYEISFRDGHLRLRKSNVKRAEEKIGRIKYALRRYQKKHSQEEYDSYLKAMLAKAEKTFDTYEVFEEVRFKAGKQYKHIKKLIDELVLV